MIKCKKLVAVGLILIVMAMLTVSPTISWLSSKSDTVVNTFAGGAISIRLDEALVGTDGKAIKGDEAKRVTSNSYKYMAGATLDKDPTPTVLKGSEECYVFLCVENELTEMFTMNYATESWLKVAEKDGKAVYAYSTKIDALESDEDIKLEPIFTTVTVSKDLTAEEISKLGERKLSVTAYAVQTDSVSSKDAIDSAIAEFIPGASATYQEID